MPSVSGTLEAGAVSSLPRAAVTAPISCDPLPGIVAEQSTQAPVPPIPLNVRGLNTKLSRLYADSFNFGFEFAVLVMTETWLRPSVYDSEILCGHYLVFRKDRMGRIGGGVLIGALDTFPSERIVLDDVDGIEFLAVRVDVLKFRLFVTCSYIPPASEYSIYERHFVAINSIMSGMNGSDRIVVLGDFDLPMVSCLDLPDTEALTPLTTSGGSEWVTTFLDIFLDDGLCQINGVLNFFGKILDLVFVGDSYNFDLSRCDPVSYPEDRYHPAFSLCLLDVAHESQVVAARDEVFSLCFKKTNSDLLNSLLSGVDWGSVCRCDRLSDIDMAVDNFYKVLDGFVSRTVPRNRPWYAPVLTRLRNDRHRCFRRYKRTGSDFDYSRYSVARSIYNMESRACYVRYIDKDETWRSSFVVPIHKSGSPFDVGNYRGIAKLSAILKVFEKMVTDVLSHGISSILDPCQHAFRKGLSATTNLVEFTSHVINQFVVGNQTHVIYTDFSKAFDRVNHKLLLYKLDRIGLASALLAWISSYLDCRMQIVSFGDSYSRCFDVPSGVPQGAGDLDSFDDWCRVNLMDLSLMKCKFMRFFRSRPIDVRYSIRGSLLEEVDSFVDLGIVMDRRLNFNGHIDSMIEAD
ncbi:uncharacterized protein LOC142235603 [Haematobia irritans]|uniref:uncharacterized protein LOC142235603 n=1 Tax=Haematobia irritans TaxID=7368 RepID=UPI003F50258A